jgi:predicted acylesterase/phospholipase RssA
MLSGGASFAKFHSGVIHALYEQDLLPRIICGSSSGALICAMICSRPYSTISNLGPYEMANPMPFFEAQTKSILEFLSNMLQGKAIMNQDVFKKFVHHFTGDLTFKEIYD